MGTIPRVMRPTPTLLIAASPRLYHSPVRPLALAILWIPLLAGCYEERVIRREGMLMGLPGAKGAQEILPEDARPRGLHQLKDEQTVKENPDGTKSLRSTNARQLLKNIFYCLDNDDPKLFVRDVLSQPARNSIFERGLPPIEAYNALKADREAVQALYDQIPQGEFTPGAIVQTIGKGTVRVRVDDLLADRMSYKGIDMIWEKGGYRLLNWVR